MHLYCAKALFCIAPLEMSSSLWFAYASLALLSACNVNIVQSSRGSRYVNENYQTFYVDPTDAFSFGTIQASIDAVPPNNNEWIVIDIKEGTYNEKITIPLDKPFIHLKGESPYTTLVFWDDHDAIDRSATFTSLADNIIVEGLSFQNTYNTVVYGKPNMRTPAVAATIRGDRSFFYDCGFIGVQDTLWDARGRHYYKRCMIQGFVDFIFGSGQSIFEGCLLVVSDVTGLPPSPYNGYITAQGRVSGSKPDGFVFIDCIILGSGKVYLGRPWGDYARVLFYNTEMSDVVHPRGWDAGNYNVETLTFADEGSQGLGADMSNRVPWANQMGEGELQMLTSIAFVDEGEGWVAGFCGMSNCGAFK